MRRACQVLIPFGLTVAPSLAAAQENVTLPPPTATLRGVEQFQLPPSGAQPAPVVVPTIAWPTPAPPPRQRPSARPRPRVIEPRPAPTPDPTPVSPTQASAPEPNAADPVAVPSSRPGDYPLDPPSEPSRRPDIAWLAGGALAIAAALALGWWLGQRSRRGRRRRSTYRVETAVPTPEPVAIVPTPPLQHAAPPPPPPAPAGDPIPAGQALVSDFRPLFIAIDESAATVQFEISVTNRSEQTADALRAIAGITTAGAELEDRVAQMLANANIAPTEAPITLAAGDTHLLNGTIVLPRDAMHTAGVGGRPMIVPVIVVTLRWRAGLGVRSQYETFMLGTGDGSGKLGPVWLDRGAQTYRPVAARRFDPALLGSG